MKNRFVLSLLCLGLLLFSCKKGGNNTLVPVSQHEVISFRFNGLLSSLDTTEAAIGQNTLQVRGNGNSSYSKGAQATLFMTVAAKVGTSVVGDNGFSASFNLSGGPYSGVLQYKAIKGTITVTAISANSVSGTFEFVGGAYMGAVNITDGQFTLPLLSN